MTPEHQIEAFIKEFVNDLEQDAVAVFAGAGMSKGSTALVGVLVVQSSTERWRQSIAIRCATRRTNWSFGRSRSTGRTCQHCGRNIGSE